MKETTPDAVCATGAELEIVEDKNDTAAKEEALPRDGGLQKYFAVASNLGPLLLAGLLALYVWPSFWSNLYCGPAEIVIVQMLGLVLDSGLSLSPTVGEISSLPGFMVLFACLVKLSGALGCAASPPALVALLTAFSSFFVLTGVWCLAMAAGFGRRVALAAGLLLLCAPVTALFARLISPDIPATALALFALSCFYRGWQGRRSGFGVPAGFALTALAGLTGGPCYLLLPLLTSVIFLVWTGHFSRASRLDALFGFALFLAIIAAWLVMVILLERADGYFYRLYGTFADDVKWSLLILWDASAWKRMLLETGLALLPWPLLAFFVSWNRVLREAAKNLKAARAENVGAAFVWITFSVAVLLFLGRLVSTGPVIMVCCLTALLLGKALLHLSPFNSRIFYLFASLGLLVSAVGLTSLGFEFSRIWLARALPQAFFPDFADSLLWAGAGFCCLAAAFILVRFVNLNAGAGALLACVILAVVSAQPLMFCLEPGLMAKSSTVAEILSKRDVVVGESPVPLTQESDVPQGDESGTRTMPEPGTTSETLRTPDNSSVEQSGADSVSSPAEAPVFDREEAGDKKQPDVSPQNSRQE
jgi:4-amino-4-deoxy-L-arabinose transferase-like glycosyltransferase